MQVFGAASEDAAVNQVPHIPLGDPSVTHHNVGPGIVGHDLIENTRQAGAVELKQELTHR
jgi:hypothetical protein